MVKKNPVTKLLRKLIKKNPDIVNLDNGDIVIEGDYAIMKKTTMAYILARAEGNISPIDE